MIRAAAYLRVSTSIQATEGDSIPAQRDAICKYISDHGMVCVGEYLDDGISGTRSDRDELQRLLDDVQAGNVDIIIITKLDRLYRSIRHYLNMMDVLDRHGVGWRAIWEQYDTTTPQGRLIVNQMMAFAQFEAENTGQRIRQVQAYKVSQGEVVSGSTPAGYRIQDKRLTPSEAAGSVLTAFRTYSRTGSLNATMRACSGLSGLPRSKPAFKRMLMNETYIGHKRTNDHFCEPIIPEALFEDVQRQLRMNVKKSQRHTYIFSGLIRCAECGCTLGGQTRIKRGKQIRLYRCPKHFNHKPAQCRNTKIITESVLEEQMMAQLRPMIENVVLEFERKAARKVDHTDQIRILTRKIDRLKDLYVNDLIDIETYKKDKADYEQQLTELSRPAPIRDVSALKDLLGTDIEDIYWSFSPANKRRFWRGIVKEIRWSADRSFVVDFLGGDN